MSGKMEPRLEARRLCPPPADAPAGHALVVVVHDMRFIPLLAASVAHTDRDPTAGPQAPAQHEPAKNCHNLKRYP